MKLEVPVDVEDYLASSLQVFDHYDSESVLDERIVRSCNAFAYLSSVEQVSIDEYVQSHRILLGNDRIFHAPTDTPVVRDQAAVVYGYLMPPMSPEVVSLMGRALDESGRRGAFATADFMTKIHPFYRANGVSARVLYAALVERGVEPGREFDEDLDVDQIVKQVHVEQVDWLGQLYPSGYGKSHLQYHTPDVKDYRWARILEMELR